MSIDTLKFVKDATSHGFSEEQAEFMANEIHSKKVGNDYLNERLLTLEERMDQKFKILSNEITIKVGGLMIIWTSISLTFLGFILKH